MNAASYARKSTEQNVAAEAKSVTRQIENARAFAATQGWTVAHPHEYEDDAISGAEFEKRPGLQRLLSALKPAPPFSALIVSEQESLGRETYETNYTIKRLAEAGVEVFEYLHGRSLTPKTALDKVLGSVQGFADEHHREASSERVHETHTRLHLAGHVVGGRVFGYRNQDVFKGTDHDGRPLRSHVDRVVDPIEAAVVRRIFELYDSGYGLKMIAKQLVGAPAPKHARREDGLSQVEGWSPSTVRTVLTRETYRGVVIWNKTRKKNNWGKSAPSNNPESQWIRVEVEGLRIIDEALWKRVQARREDIAGRTVRFSSGRLSGRPPKNAAVHLLAGLATCGVCGGGLVVEAGGNKRGRRPEYWCYRHRVNGTCSNTLKMPVSEVDEAVLHAVEEHALTPEAVEQVTSLNDRDDIEEKRAALAKEWKGVEKRIGG